MKVEAKLSEDHGLYIILCKPVKKIKRKTVFYKQAIISLLNFRRKNINIENMTL